jgi:hypothetical protein
VRHHTKDKGDLGVGFAVADLLKAGIQPALLISEHLPFDLIAVSSGGVLRRVSVKYRKMRGNCIKIELNSIWSDRRGIHRRKVDLSTFDCLAVFCQDTGLVYYLRASELETVPGGYLSLRIAPTKNNQHQGVRWAADFLGAEQIFE